MTASIFDRNKLRLHRNRAASEIAKYDFLLKHAADILEDHLEPNLKPENILELGARHGLMTNKLLTLFPDSDLLISDISSRMLSLNQHENYICIDEEKDGFPQQKYDLIISSMNLHWINNPPQFLYKVRSSLNNEGIFIANFFGDETLSNLRKAILDAELINQLPATPHISPMIKQEDITSLMQQAGFKDIITTIDEVKVDYHNIYQLLKDLKGMGENSNLIQQANYALPKQVLSELLSNPKTFQEKFHIITIRGKR